MIDFIKFQLVVTILCGCLLITTHQLNEQIRIDSFQTNLSCDPKLFSWGTVQLRRPKPNVTRVTGTVELRKDIGQEYLLKIRISRKGFAFQSVHQNVCDYMANKHSPCWAEIQPSRVQCPIPKGRYLVVNFFVNEFIFKDGSYTIEMALNQDSRSVCRALVELSVLQKGGAKGKV